jgi:hypothetical protein
MSTTASPLADQPLYDLVSGPASVTISDVITRMQAIDALLPADDGIKWFNRLYLMVTQQVDLHPPGGAWRSPLWLTRLDVELISPDAIFHIPGRPEPMSGPAGYLAIIGMMRVGFPDIQWALEEMVAEDDKVAARFTMRGTHRGTFSASRRREKQSLCRP